ncbi:hypothetical protein NIES2098_42580 [Calothrix sp. NIES-2098]|nr:hypothetical protein NIES2098_42580 [Calothrix sp. NIES-2098]
MLPLLASIHPNILQRPLYYLPHLPFYSHIGTAFLNRIHRPTQTTIRCLQWKLIIARVAVENELKIIKSYFTSCSVPFFGH